MSKSTEEKGKIINVIITGLELACFFGPEKPMTLSCGTLCYAAPEVFAGKGKEVYTEACDIWSCGVSLYAMLTGSFPYQRGVDPAGYNQEPLRAAGISKPACDLIARLLTLDPAARPTAAEVLKDQWLNP